MTTTPRIARTLEELSSAVSQCMGEAEAHSIAQAQAEQERRQLQQDPAPQAPGEPSGAPADRSGVVTPRIATLGLVPTMGALHEGHATLIRRAREQNDVVAVSVYVNPLQFGPHEDYERYPRTPEADLSLLEELGVDVVFMPDDETMYPGGEPLVRVSSGRLGEVFEGVARGAKTGDVVRLVRHGFSP